MGSGWAATVSFPCYNTDLVSSTFPLDRTHRNHSRSIILAEMMEKTRNTDSEADGLPRLQQVDIEKQPGGGSQNTKKKSAYQGLGWLDRLLVLWIFLAIVIGILLGNFVNSVGPALQKGKFVNVSVPIGKSDILTRPEEISLLVY